MPRSLAAIQRDLAVNVKQIRRRCDFSQEALALAADVDRTYVSQIERAIGNPSLRILAALAERLEVDVVDLLAPNRPASRG